MIPLKNCDISHAPPSSELDVVISTNVAVSFDDTAAFALFPKRGRTESGLAPLLATNVFGTTNADNPGRSTATNTDSFIVGYWIVSYSTLWYLRRNLQGWNLQGCLRWNGGKGWELFQSKRAEGYISAAALREKDWPTIFPLQWGTLIGWNVLSSHVSWVQSVGCSGRCVWSLYLITVRFS